MASTVRIHEVDTISGEASSTSTNSPRWQIEVSAAAKSVSIELCDPATKLATQALPGLGSEESIAWYLEEYMNEPFETTKSESAAELLTAYGRDLASQIVASDLLPKNGHIRLQISTARRTGNAPESLSPSLHHLHWEVLEDVRVWPAGFQLSEVNVVRSVTDATTKSTSNSCREKVKPNTYSILLVVSRPRPEEAIEYQLVAKSLVAIVERLSSTNRTVNISLKILRPPTWQSFREDLSDHHYDLVHFDMNGKIEPGKEGNARAVLEFSKPHLRNPLKIKSDWRAGDEVGKELAKAGVRTVVLNACNSATFRASAPGTNLAEILLSHGVHSVLAMACKVTEEAVDIFMGAFYQLLLADGSSIEDATRAGRRSLLRSWSRRASYMYQVQLADYIVPVLYISKAAPEVAKSNGSFFSMAKSMLSSVMQYAPAATTARINGSAEHRTKQQEGLPGRDFNILSLEVLLSVSPVVLLHGQGGVGKTKFLQYACRWWKATNWITAAAYIDFGQPRSYLNGSIETIARSIAVQLEFERKDMSAQEVIEKLQAGRYLVVFDSAEVFDTENPGDQIYVRCPGKLAKGLTAFIDKLKATVSRSVVVVASRLDTTTIASIPLECHKYQLPGLSVLDSVELLQNLALTPGQRTPEGFHSRENIELLRRAAIILEGNPAALQLIVPELKRVNLDGKTLLDNLLYGVCTTAIRQDLSLYGRFERSVIDACALESLSDADATGVTVYHLCPFWNLMPKDLHMYYWFFGLSTYEGVPEYNLKTWLSQNFRRLVEMAPTGQSIRAHWPDMERRLMSMGILSHATITKQNGDSMPCYHVHPIFTLLSRGLLNEAGWKQARFAFVRAAILWDSHDNKYGADNWASVKWDSGHQGPQHEDYLYNWRAIALAWSVKDGNPVEEASRMGISLFDCVYRLITDALYGNPRQGRLLIPHFTLHLLHLHGIIDLLRPNQTPTDQDVYAILTYSWDLWTLETGLLEPPYAKLTALIGTALDVFRRWRIATTTQARSGTNGELAFPSPATEVSYQQLLHALAISTQDTGDILGAKKLYEAHLATNPVTTDTKMLRIISRWHFQSLGNWGGCVFTIAQSTGAVHKNMIRDGLRSLLEAAWDDGKPGKLMGWMMKNLTENPEEFCRIKVRDEVAFCLEREPEAVKKFGWFAKGLLEMPLYAVYEDLFAQPNEPGADDATSAPSKTKAERMFKEITKALEPVNTKDGGLRRVVPHTLLMKMGASDHEFIIRQLAGDTTGAAAVWQQTELAREALSSTTSTGWQRLAELHMGMYMVAVTEAAEPDYKKGLTHLKEWWKLHEHRAMSPRSRCCALIDLAACHHGLGQVAETSRAVIQLIQVGQSMVPTDCLKGDVEATHNWLYKTIFGFRKLHVFLDVKAAILPSTTDVAQLTFPERAMMYQIMTRAKDRQRHKLQAQFLSQGFPQGCI
ncbi:CHAT domain-containing protein [Pochonia chlamydosporia 170]|uniref:CHAT domain-containing protein n=1 Tax=Pochonia chlamydosporia 170 TaxID=1380566 RepID=A0A179F3P1_METCM|nr:CHAT domain-containing protein [Pochonia chlamydosporia 170]OAQ59803.1 CHAT domain-containing protein [Pochonia chlamydosporia 170]